MCIACRGATAKEGTDFISACMEMFTVFTFWSLLFISWLLLKRILSYGGLFQKFMGPGCQTAELRFCIILFSVRQLCTNWEVCVKSTVPNSCSEESISEIKMT